MRVRSNIYKWPIESLCGTQPPAWLQRSWPPGVPLTQTRAGLCDQCRNVDVWLSKLGHKRHCCFHLVLSWILFSGKSSCPVRKTLKQPSGQVYKARSWGLLPTASTIWPVAWKSQLENGPSSPGQAFRCSQPWPTSWLHSHRRHWARATQLSHSQIPDPPKLGETV